MKEETMKNALAIHLFAQAISKECHKRAKETAPYILKELSND